MKQYQHEIGIGATEKLRLRVSVATIVRVLFNSNQDQRTMLALERTATLQELDGKKEVVVKAKPFGGGVRLTNPLALKELIGDFNYDSERSRQEMDFRIQVHPASWGKIKEICGSFLKGNEWDILDPSPERELAEEFQDSLRAEITPDQYHLKPKGIIIEDTPVETKNVRATGLPTVRIYYVFEARITDPGLIDSMLDNSHKHSEADLKNTAWADARKGGRGRANAILTISLDDLLDFYFSIPVHQRDKPAIFNKYQLDGNLLALLEGIDNP
jgi:hypothetical protein